MNESRTIVVDGTEFSYTERLPSREQGKAPLLLLHGLIASAETFGALIAHLPDDRRIVALNLPGRDTNDHATPSRTCLAGLAQIVAGLATAIHLDRPIILGHSHGGSIALQIGVSFPDRLTGLILLAPAHPFLYRERRMIWFFNSSLGNLIARNFRFLPRPFHGMGFRRLLGPKGRKAKVDFRPYRACLTRASTVEAVLRLIKSWNADLDALGQALEADPIRLPVLLLWGDRDPVVPMRTADALSIHLKCWERFTLGGVGHLPNDEAPSECAALIETWLIWLETGVLAKGKG